jgi:putative membrane protein
MMLHSFQETAMQTALSLLVALVAVEHLYFLVLEMFLWTKPKGRKIFGLTEQFANESKSLAANQGLYNGFLAAGLIWSLLQPDVNFAHQLQLFFLGCVLVAAIFGGITVKRTILFIQGTPALIAMLICFYN